MPSGDKEKDKKLPANGIYNPLNMALYSYVGNAPLVYVDDYGYFQRNAFLKNLGYTVLGAGITTVAIVAAPAELTVGGALLLGAGISSAVFGTTKSGVETVIAAIRPASDKQTDIPTIRAAAISIATKDIESAKKIDTIIDLVQGVGGAASLGKKFEAGTKVDNFETYMVSGGLAQKTGEFIKMLNEQGE